jgi:hypothetical protein
MSTAAPMEHRRTGLPPRDRSQSEQEELTALRDENRELRELVIQLSKLVIRNVMEHK